MQAPPHLFAPFHFVHHTREGCAQANPGHPPSGHLVDPATAKNWTLDQYDAFCASSARHYLEWALREPQIGAIHLPFSSC